MLTMVHVNISVCSRVGIPATGACVGHPACGYDDFFGGESWFFSHWWLWLSYMHWESPKKLPTSHWDESICLWRRLPVRGVLNRDHLNTVLNLGTVSSKLLDTEMGLCLSVIPMAVFWPLWETLPVFCPPVLWRSSCGNPHTNLFLQTPFKSVGLTVLH